MSTARFGPDESSTAAYRVPSVDKALDVLECLAVAGTSMTQAQVSRALRRSPSEIYRVLATLERRGFVSRDPGSGGYELTLRLFELAHLHSPFQPLVRFSEMPMRELARKTGESCHLSVVYGGRLLVLHQEDAPARVRISVELGSTIPLSQACSGRVLLAQLEEFRCIDLIEAETPLGDVHLGGVDGLLVRLEEIRSRGYETARGESLEAVSDVAVPIGSAHSRTLAALAINGMPRVHREFVDRVLPDLLNCAATIAHRAGLLTDSGPSERFAGLATDSISAAPVLGEHLEFRQ